MQSVEIDTESSTLVLTYSKSALTMEAVEREARLIGVSIAEQFAHESFEVEGLECPECALKIEKGVSLLPGVVFAGLNYAASTLLVEYEPAKIGTPRIIRRVRGLGYRITPKLPPGVERPVRPVWLETRTLLTALSGALIAAGMVSARLAHSEAAGHYYWLAALLLCGVQVAKTGILGLRALAVDTSLLVTVAGVGAALIGDLREAATVVFLFSLGSVLESYTVSKTRRSVQELIRLFPTQATIKRDGQEMKVPLEDIKIGDTLIVRPGDRIATDGFVAAGESWVNEAAITGESAPVEKTKLAEVYAGTLNDRGYLEVTVTRTVADNTLSRIIHLVEEAQAQKSPSQRFSQRFGRIYSPIVILLAAVVILVPVFAFGKPFAAWFPRALTLLVVACPCALVISTPVAVVAAIGNAAKSGLLIKGGAHLENLGSLRVMAFDKTGTLTRGRLEVVDVIPVADRTAEEVLAIAASIERQSEHPLAGAICSRADADGIEAKPVISFEALPGKGVRAVCDGETCHVCSERALGELGIAAGPEAAAPPAGEGKTVVYVCAGARVIGLIVLRDVPKPGTAEVIAKIRKLGIRRIVMLTGDSEATAAAIGAEIGMDEIRAGLLPEEKVAVVRELLRHHGRAAMVGDGINDAPALAASTVGIAMGGLGAQAVLETADVVLMADDLRKLPFGVALSRRAARIIKANIGFSLAVVAALIGGALTGRLGLAGGILGHEGSALLVILNGMRLLRFSHSVN